MRSYIIKTWETEDEREQGLSEIIEVGFDKLENAIEQARKIGEDNNYACIEVQDSKQNKSYCTIDANGEKIDNFNYIDAIRQEKINYFYNLVYGEEDFSYKYLPFIYPSLIQNKKLETIPLADHHFKGLEDIFEKLPEIHLYNELDRTKTSR